MKPSIAVCTALAAALAMPAHARDGLADAMGSILGGLVGKAVGKETGKALTDDQWTTQMQQIAVSVNQKAGLPKMIDKVTRIDRVTGGPGRLLTYHHTIFYQHAQVSPAALSQVFARIRGEACQQDWLKRLHGIGVSVQYAYTATDGYLGTLRLDATDCRA